MRPLFAEGLDVLFDFFGRLEAIPAKMFMAGKVACAARSSNVSAGFRGNLAPRLIGGVGFDETGTIALRRPGM